MNLLIELKQKTARIIIDGNEKEIPLAVIDYLNPMVAAIAMSLSSVSVVTNSSRLKKVKI